MSTDLTYFYKFTNQKPEDRNMNFNGYS